MGDADVCGAGGNFAFPPKEELLRVVSDLAMPIAQRMRAVFYLRTVGGDDAVESLCSALLNKAGTTLFRHEIAYVLGQMEAQRAIPTLERVLRDASDDAIVRHECGEALGAIAEPSSLVVLDELSTDTSPEVAETCQIASKRVRWVIAHAGNENASNMKDNPYESIDPAPSAKKPSSRDIADIHVQAMFSLRNNGSKAAVLALTSAFTDPSPLFRHEVAYVLGQLQHAASIPALKARIDDPLEHEMVRHEAAEALGAIGTSDAVEYLAAYKASDTVMLRESCEVALDAVDYWATTN